MDRVAVVLLNWNGTGMLRRYLPSVVRCSHDDAVVYVADNASTDGSLELLSTEFPSCRVIALDRNWGFAGGYNKALAQIEAEYYVLLNTDVEVTPHWLSPLVSFMDLNPDVAACQPKLLSAVSRGSFEYAGACGGFIDRYGYPFCRGRIFDTVEDDRGQYDTEADVLWATGAALMIRSSDFRAAGGFDSRFFAHNEEIDLCWRLRISGRRVCCVPSSIVYHFGGGTLPKSNPMKTFLNFRNNLTMLYKCLPDGELRHVMRVRLFLDYVAAFEMLLLKRNWGDFVAVLRARRAFNRWKADFRADREAIQRGRKVADIPECRRLSILWQYYVRGRKLFSALTASSR